MKNINELRNQIFGLIVRSRRAKQRAVAQSEQIGLIDKEIEELRAEIKEVKADPMSSDE